MTTPKGMTTDYGTNTYRYTENGRVVETVVVQVGSYEDTRLGLESLESDSGWRQIESQGTKLVNDEAAVDQPTPTVPAGPEHPVDDASSPDPGPVESTSEALGQPDQETQEGVD